MRRSSGWGSRVSRVVLAMAASAQGGGAFDGIIVTAGAAEIPSPLVDQLALGGRLVMPVGTQRSQILTVIRRTNRGLREDQREDCVFVPLQGAYGWK